MTFQIAADGDIESALEQNGIGEEMATTDGVRQLLADINADIVDYWPEHTDVIDEGRHEIVHEDRETIVMADHGGHFWREQFDAMDVPDHLRDAVVSVQHRMARAECDYSWSASYPVVVRKPPAWQMGETHALRELARRTDGQGSAARAVDQYAVRVHGYSQAVWSSLTGRNESTISRTVRDKRTDE